jgi:hypothetical protein
MKVSIFTHDFVLIVCTPIINEDQLMKTKSSKLKDNEHCESVMNVTNDENYTDGLNSNVISS